MASTMEGVVRNGDNGEPTAPPTTSNDEISADEVALYDRQIRLWGMDAQARMRNANILLVTIRALGNEIAKNLVLAGIGAITVNDSKNVTEEDLGAQFFLEESMVGMNRAEAAAPALQRLNPRVAVTTDVGEISGRDTEFYKKFSMVIVTEADLGRRASARTQPFAYTERDNLSERDKGNIETKIGKETRTRSIVSATTKKEAGGKFKEFVTKEEVYSPISQVVTSQIDKTWRPKKKKGVSAVLSAIFALWKFQEDHQRRPDPYEHKEDTKIFMTAIHKARSDLGLGLENMDPAFAISFLDSVDAELSPVAAILGGMIAQGVINYLGKREQPLQNLLVFDGDSTNAPIYSLHPQDEE
ncbi:hypothetical protein ABW20_dc0106389 [Dactylellina cionopaga]|nr:hypothetical protein ABW20_dc0106389 [Dactylellina cionopaga]